MVKLFPYLFLLSISFGFQVEQEETCDGEKIQKVKNNGLRSLKLSEIPSYIMELKNCKNKEKAKTIKKSANDKQLVDDAENSGTFVGRTSSCAYCVIAFILYLAFV